MDRAAQYRKDMQDLLEKWKAADRAASPSGTPGVFVSDGVVCPEKWFAQPVRPLFLLKEAYHGEGDWDLVTDEILQHKKISKPTWRCVSQWARGLLHTDEQTLCPFADAEELRVFGNEYLQRIAAVNVKKRSGGSRSEMRIINAYARRDKALLRQQLEYADPTVIVCGYTISSLNIIMEETIKDHRAPNPYLYYSLRLNGHPVIVLDYWHPAVRAPEEMSYYALMAAYQQARKSMSKTKN